jgi:ABC-type uncharacterized transport system ATPase subunit
VSVPAVDSSGGEVALRFDGVTKRFGDAIVNDNVSFSVRRGEVVALLGENGAGKTTLMNILFGHYRADGGSVEVFGEQVPPGSPKAALARGVGMVHQHFALAANLTVLENLMLGAEPLHRPWSRQAQARQKLRGLAQEYGFKLDLDRLVGDLSVGERQRVEILKVLYRDARILVLDEPTAVLSPQEAAGLFDMLRKLVGAGLAVIFISHKLHEVLSIASRVVVLRQGKVVAERPTAGTSTSELAELMVGHSVTPTVLPPQEPGQTMVRLTGVTLAKPDGTAALDGINLSVAAHQIVGIAGVSGNGQSELALLLSGLAKPDTGRIELFGLPLRRFTPTQMIALNVGRIPEDRHQSGVAGALPLWENAMLEQYRSPAFARWGWRRIAEGRRFAARLIRDFDIRGATENVRTSLLSGGNMQKVIIGRVLSRRPALIVASHPTRGLDVGAIDYVHQKLVEARRDGAAILLISDDLDEIMQLADKVVVMYQGRVSPAMDRGQVDLQAVGMAMTGGGQRAH